MLTLMKTNLLNRTWISPLITVSFGALTLTGLLLFFHVKNGPIMMVHEWFGWILAGAGTVHLLLNWKPLLACCRQRMGVLALVLALAAVLGLVVVGANRPAHGPRHEPGENAPAHRG